ncbi:MAG: cation transporter [Elusimicrobia bacterium]|nr:cation transporter [Elusimicrobiota bacterium]
MKSKIAAIGAIVSAALASVCCIGPLVFAALGLGSVGLAASLEQYRPYFLAAMAIFLGIGFLQVYRRRDQCSDGVCRTEAGGGLMKKALWIVTVAALGMATFPSWGPLLMDDPEEVVSASAEKITLSVSGMYCAACKASIEKSLKKVAGVEEASVDFDNRTATVYASRGRVAPADLVQAIRNAGPYSAKVEN